MSVRILRFSFHYNAELLVLFVLLLCTSYQGFIETIKYRSFFFSTFKVIILHDFQVPFHT
jgi:hypothetical protein